MAEQTVAGGRDTSADGKKNIKEAKLLTSYGWAWKLAQKQPRLERVVNGYLVNSATAKMPYRPNPFSTMSPYTSWASLTDKTYSSRHLPGIAKAPEEPEVDRVADLFLRRDGKFIPSDKSTVLFAYFAQWFTDGFLRSDRSNPEDHAKNNSNHEIDLMQVYGLTPNVTEQLRDRDSKKGLLKSQVINGEEYPQYAYDANGNKKPDFSDVPDIPTKLRPPTKEQLAKFFAVGSDTANIQLGFVLMNVLFFREHNRIARALGERYPDWDDERLFQTARNILIVLLIKLVVEE